MVAIIIGAVALSLGLMQNLSSTIAPLFLGLNLMIAAYPVYTGLKKIKAPILLITQPDDLVFHADGVKQMVEAVKAAGGKIDHVTLSSVSSGPSKATWAPPRLPMAEK